MNPRESFNVTQCGLGVFCALCSSALNTQLVDNTFPEDDFEVVLGSLEVKWQRIGPYLLCLVSDVISRSGLKSRTVV